MNIIELAKEAGFEVWEADYALQGQLERFAVLVAAHEREACAKVCDEAIAIAKVSKELLGSSEVLARVVTTGAIYQAGKLAAAIRARSEK